MSAASLKKSRFARRSITAATRRGLQFVRRASYGGIVAAPVIGLGLLGSSTSAADIILPPDKTIGIQTIVPGLLEGRVAGNFNTTDPNPGTSPNPAVGGIKLEPILAQMAGNENMEPWPDNTTHVYTGQMNFPDNGTAGDGISEFAFAEHFDDSTEIKIDGVVRLSNTVWNAVNTTGRLELTAGWHDVEFRFGEGTGGWGPSTDTNADADANNPWDNTLGFGVDFTSPIAGDLKQPNYTRPVDPGNGTVFRVRTFNTDTSQDNMNVIVNSNATLNVLQGRTVPFGTLTVANATTFTINSPGGPSTFTATNIGATATFNVIEGTAVTGPLKSTGPVTSITKTGAGVLNVPTSAGSTVTSNPPINVNGGTLAIGVSSGGSAVGAGAINLNSGTLALANDALVANGPGVFNVTGEFLLNNPFDASLLTGFPDSANTFGWVGLDSKTNLDTRLAGKTFDAVRAVNMPINFPRGDGNLIDGGGNDVETDLFNIEGANLGVSLRGDQDFIVRFTGKLNVTAAGPTAFGLASNDGSVLFVDTDQGPGTTWVKVADNNRYNGTGGGNFQEHGNTGLAGTDPGTPAIPQPAVPNLTAGVYDFAIGWFNWTDSTSPPPQSGIEMYWVPAGGTRGIVPYAAGGPVTLSNTLTVSGNSGLNIQAPTATLADLRMNPGSRLAVSGNQLTTGITATGAGTVSIGAISGPDVQLTALNDGGNAVLFAAGPGRARLSGSGPGPGFGATSSVGATSGGTLVATTTASGTTLNGVPVRLEGGTLELNSPLTPVAGSPFAGEAWASTTAGTDAGAGDTVISTGNGVSVLGAPTQTGSSPAVNYPSSDAWPFAPHIPAVQNEDFFARFTGTVPLPAGTTTFTTNSDDGSTLFVDLNNDNDFDDAGELIVDNRGLHAMQVRTGTATVPTAGNYRVRTQMYERGGGAGLIATYGPDANSQIFLGQVADLSSVNYQSNVTSTADSTINVTGGRGATLGHISAASNTLTIQGGRLKVNDVSAGTGGTVLFTSPAGAEVAGAIGGTGTIKVDALRTVDFTGSSADSSGSPSLSISRNGTMNFAPGAGNTFGGAAVASIEQNGTLHAANGIVDLSNAVATSTLVPGTVLSGGLTDVVGDFYNAATVPIAQNSANTFGWSGLDSKALFDAALAGKTPLVTRNVELEINFPRGNASPVDGGTNDEGAPEIFNMDGANLGVPLTGNTDFVVRFTGKLNVTAAGPTGFGMAANDGAVLFLDLDQGAGANWVKVADHNRFSGTGGGNFDEHGTAGAGNPGAPAIPQPAMPDLSVGSYDFAVGFFNANNNEAGVELYWDPAGPAGRSIIPLGDVVGPTVVQVDSGATLKLGAVVNVSNVNIASAARLELHGPTSKIVGSALNIAGTPAAPTATLDLTDAALVLDYPATGPTAAEVADVRSRIISGRGGVGLGKTWNGLGITSSTAAAAPTNSMSVGYAVNGTLPLAVYTEFLGQPVDPSSVLMRLTRTADANLDGVVNNDDVAVVGANYAPGAPKARWDLGDFDYNGSVDNDDITLLGAFYTGAAPAPTPDIGSSGVAAVPEPASWLMLTIGGLGAGLAGWRRKKKQLATSS